MKSVSLLSPSSKLTCGHRLEQVASWRARYPAALHLESPVRELGPERRFEPKRALGEYSDYAKLAKLVNTRPQRLEWENQRSHSPGRWVLDWVGKGVCQMFMPHIPSAHFCGQLQ